MFCFCPELLMYESTSMERFIERSELFREKVASVLYNRKTMEAHKSNKYINKFLYVTVTADRRSGKDVLVCCSGVNVDRFSPITKGRHGIGSNPAVRGLQLVNFGVRDLALSRGATPRALRGKDCGGTAPTVDTWYTERLLIENASASLPDEIIMYSVMSLLKKIFKACMLDIQLPDTLLKADELQVFIETLCAKYGGNQTL
jgi:hypothetical protein